MQLQLPHPSADALCVTQQLHDLIALEVRQQGGWISFARYMEMALYAPQLGYYSGGSQKLGKDGDFTTAPEISPLFGASLAQVIAACQGDDALALMEFGAGSGKLAHAILSELRLQGVSVASYAIIEISAELRARQEALLREFPQVRWLEAFPEAFSGVVLANEVLDAMPVHLVVKGEQAWFERGIGLLEEKLVFQDRPCDGALLAQIPERDQLPLGYLTEVHPIAQAFMHTLASMLRTAYLQDGRGSLAILIDYGFPAHEYYLSQRAAGTLMCHYRHHAHADPLYLPGLQDITAHVDFTAMAQAALDGGLDLLAYTSQAGFLLDAGISDLLLRTSPEDPLRYLPQANAVQKLVSPAEMGELFKVLVLGLGVEFPTSLNRHDRQSRL